MTSCDFCWQQFTTLWRLEHVATRRRVFSCDTCLACLDDPSAWTVMYAFT